MLNHGVTELNSNLDACMVREELSHVADVWAGYSKTTRVGDRNSIERHFHVRKPLRPLSEIEVEVIELKSEIAGLVKGAVG